MVRLRIALGVASSLVAVAALTIVFAGTGMAQGNGTGPNVTVANTPLPVTGNLTATIPGTVNVTGNVTATIPGAVNVTGNVNAAVTGDVNATVTGNVNAAVTGDVNATITGPVTVNNPSNNPVLIRDVDAPSPQELWQIAVSLSVPQGGNGQSPTLAIDVPAGKVLVIEHLNFRIGNTVGAPIDLVDVVLSNGVFGANQGIQEFIGQPSRGASGATANINETTKFYVTALSLEVRAERPFGAGVGVFHGVLTGYLVNYP